MKRNFYAFIFCILLTPFGISAQLDLTVLGTYTTGIFDESATEIVAYNEQSQRIYSTNGDSGEIDVIDVSDPTNPTLLFSINLSAYGDKANSVTTHGEWVAMAVEADDSQAPGKAVFFDLEGNFIVDLDIGALPDHISASENGRKVMVACEGEPDDDYTIDPMGIVAVINVPEDVYELSQNDVTLLDFTAYNNAVLDESIRVNNNPGFSSVAQDLEPEYCAFSQNGQTGYVTLQENNAVAVIDLKTNTIAGLVGLGFKDHSVMGNGIDASNNDGVINISTWDVYGMYQPDAIKTYKANGQTYLLTANEGDARDYDGYSEEERVKDLVLDPVAYPDAATLQLEENLGRLNSTTATGDMDGDGDVDQIFAYGARSFSIWDASGQLVYDSGDDFEQITAQEIPLYFNANNDNNTFDNRSDDKGPEPEAIEIARIKGNQYAFIGLERVGGIMIYNITDPYNPMFVNYINNRDFTQDVETAAAGDLGPEDIVFIPRSKSPTNDALLAVSNEVSGTITLYAVEDAVPGNAPFADSQHGVEPITGFEVFPNPASWNLNVSLPDTESPALVRIFDTHGKLLWTRQSDEYQRAMQIDLAGLNLQNGLYVVTMTAGKQTKARPFQVQQ